MAESVYNLEESIDYNVRHFTRALRLQLISNFRLNNLDVRIEEWITLAYLYKHEDKNQIYLGDLLMQDKTAVTRLLDQLENRRQIKRIIDKKDKRNRIIRITAEGKKAYKKILPVVEQTMAEANAGVSASDYKKAVEVLKKMSSNLMAKM